jgi:glutathione S-transferase
LPGVIERIAEGGGTEEARNGLQQELSYWESVITGDYFTGGLSAVDLTLYPFLALILRIANRQPRFVEAGFVGPRLSAWLDRMHALPLVQRTLAAAPELIALIPIELSKETSPCATCS